MSSEQRPPARILGTVVELIGTTPLESLTMPGIAERSGVSLRTLYRYYPHRNALAEALAAWIAERLVYAPLPETPEEVARVMEEVGPRFEESLGLVRVLVRTGIGREVRSPRRAERVAAVDAAIADVLDALPNDEQRRVQALVRHLSSVTAWLELRDESGLEGEEAGRALGWAITVLLAEAARSTTANRKKEER